MSKIDKLLEELCPDGVPIKTIGETCRIERGKVFSKQYVRENPGIYPLYSSQTLNDGLLGLIHTYNYDGEYLNWTTDGANAGTIFHRKGKFSITNVSGLIKPLSDDINVRYLYYILSVITKSYVSSGMGNPKLMSNVMSTVKYPLPPLEVQNEIVQILDNFTELEAKLEAKLEAELEARTKQYEYYRNKLLDFSTGSVGVPRIDKMLAEMCPDGVQFYQLKDIATQYSGFTAAKNKWSDNGNCQFIDYMNAYRNIKIDIADLKFATITNFNKTTVQKGDILFTSASETPDECAISSEVENYLKKVYT